MYPMPRALPSPVALVRPVYVADVDFATTTEKTLSKKGGNLPGDLFLYGLELEIEGRLAVGTANADSEHADSPYSLIEEVRLEGYHRFRKQREKFYSLRGPEVRQLAMLYNMRAPGTTGALGVATGNKDFRFQLPIIFPPERASKAQQVGFLLDTPNWDDIVLTVKWGDGKSVLNPAATTTYTFTAFGSATGSPVCKVTALQTIFGKNFKPSMFRPGLVWRYFDENTSSALTSTATAKRLYDLTLGAWIRSVLVKTGVKDTEVTSGYNAYGSLSNAILAQIKFEHGVNNIIRHFNSYTQFRELTGKMFGITPDNGHGVFEFCESGDLSTLLPTQGFIAEGVEAFIRADVTGAANQAALFAVQEIRGIPAVG